MAVAVVMGVVAMGVAVRVARVWVTVATVAAKMATNLPWYPVLSPRAPLHVHALLLVSAYLAGQRARAAVRRKEAELIDLRRFPHGRRVRWMGGSASDARWVVRARTHLCRTTADARRRSRPRTQQALHSRWNFTALEELCTLVVLYI